MAKTQSFGLRLLLTIASAAAVASAQASLNVQFTGTAYGKPGQIDLATFGNKYPEATNHGGTLTLGGNVLPFISMEVVGENVTDLVINSPSFDSIFFEDPSPTPIMTGDVVTGRRGTMHVAFSTGVFEGLNIALPYVFTCDTGCPTMPLPSFPLGAFGGTFTANTSGVKIPEPAAPPTGPPPQQTSDSGVVESPVLSGLRQVSGLEAPPPTPTPTPQQNFVLKDSVESRAASNGGPDGALIFPTPVQFVPITYNASATCGNLLAGCWLTIPNSTGSVAALTSGSVTANLDWSSLPPGVYPSNFSITLTDGTDPPVVQNTPVNLILTDASPYLQVSESAISFQAVANAPAVQQVHQILLATSGAAIPYQVTTSMLTGGSWLSATKATGTVPASGTDTFNIAVNPAGLAAGSYFGRVDISAPTASTALQSVEVALTVAANAPAAPILSTTGLVFVTQQGVNPASQPVTLSTSSSKAITITPGVEVASGGTWLKATAPSTNLISGAPITQTVTVNAIGLAPGIYGGTLQESNGTNSYPIAVVLVVTAASGTCTPTQLLPVFTNLYNNFELPAAFPISVQAQVVDDCGSPLTSGSVSATPLSDSAFIMTALGNGRWAGTWEPHGATPGLTTLGISAQSASGLAGAIFINGTIDANTALPVVTPGGIASAAVSTLGPVLAPGGFISIYGSNLAPSVSQSESYPWQTTLAGTQVFLGGQALPLQFVSPGQINAVVPVEAAVNSIQELLVEQNGMYSLPETVVLSSSSPAAFTEASSPGAGAIIVVKSNGTTFVASSSQPASAGDVLEVYCTGLGSVNPPVADGAAASLTTISYTVNPVTATIGGQSAQVLFAGLAPGYAGVYQVDVAVPSGIAAGASVPVVLTQLGFPSAPVTVAIH